MHELAITESLVDCILEHVGDARVLRVVVEIGALSAVVPDAIRACFELCSKGSALDGATLEVVTTEGAARCDSCGGERVVTSAWESCESCECGSGNLAIVRGQELRIREVEVI
jgi:hydrogenase nickel incorporation protein HypA/HybF